MKIQSIRGTEKPYITIDAEALVKFYHILHSKYDKEFTAFTHAEKNGKEYRIYDIFIPNQVNTSTHTELDGEDLVGMLKDGADISLLNGHIHSHVNMSVTPSSTDEKEILSRAELAGFNAALIINKKEEMFGHIADMDLGFYMSDVDIYINYPHSNSDYDNDMLESIKKLTSLNDVRKLLEFSEWDYYTTKNTLDPKIIEDLDNYVKTRFKSPISTSNYKNTLPSQPWNKKKQEESKNIDAWDIRESEFDFDYSEYDIAQYEGVAPGDGWENSLMDKELDDLTDEEYYDYLNAKSASSYTDKEWLWYSNYEDKIYDAIN